MGETITTNPLTGGQKGVKDEAYSLLPWPQLREVARVYSFGCKKYERDNWRKGYDWSKSVDALFRHIEQFWSGEDRDSESGLPHLGHAIFHCLTLLYFMEHHTDLDDRPKSAKLGEGDLVHETIPVGARIHVTTGQYTGNFTVATQQGEDGRPYGGTYKDEKSLLATSSDGDLKTILLREIDRVNGERYAYTNG